jgi:carnitine 3-dehydrogenase
MKQPLLPFEEIKTIAVLGAGGTVGASWVAMFLHHGFAVIAQDPSPTLAARLDDFIARADPALRRLQPTMAARGRLTLTTEIADLASAHFAQENVPENQALKRKVLAQLDALLDPGAVIASSTSALLRSQIVADCGRAPERVIVGHPFNPPHLLPLVELVGQTPDSPAVQWAADFYTRLGKKPIVVRKEVIGHIANRLNSSIYREAVSLIEQGIATVEDVDAAMTTGPGLRWAVMGPHLLYHLGGGPGGIAHYLEHLGPSQVKRWSELKTPELTDDLKRALIEGVAQECDGASLRELEARRDAAIIALIEALRRASERVIG